MVNCEDRYFECPKCSWAISFHYNYDKGIYTSLCPYCKNKLEIDKNEYEDDRVVIEFTPDF